MGNWDHNPYKWSYGPRLITARGKTDLVRKDLSRTEYVGILGVGTNCSAGRRLGFGAEDLLSEK